MARSPRLLMTKANRALGGDEGEAGVVEDVIVVEEDDAAQAVDLQMIEQGVAAGAVFVGADAELGDWEGHCQSFKNLTQRRKVAKTQRNIALLT